MCVFVLMHMYITEPRPSTSQLQQVRSVHHASQSITKELYCTLHGHTFRPRPGIVDHVPSGSAELRPPRPLDHVDHVPSGSTELRPPRPPDHVTMMIATKNGATTIATTVMATGRKARGPDNFIATNQMSIQRSPRWQLSSTTPSAATQLLAAGVQRSLYRGYMQEVTSTSISIVFMHDGHAI